MSRLRAGVLSLALFALLLPAPHLRAGEKEGVAIDLDGVPAASFADETLHLRLRFYREQEPPAALPARSQSKIPAAVEVVRLRPGGKEEREEPRIVELPPYNDTALPFRLSFAPDELKPQTVRILLRAGEALKEDAIRFVAAAELAPGLHAGATSLTDASGARVVVLVAPWSETAYRRWAIPRWFARSAAPSPEAGVLLLAAAPEEAEEPGRGEDALLAEAADAFSLCGRAMTLLRPEGKGDGASPLLQLLAAAGRREWPAADVISTLIIAPGAADVRQGTPLRLCRSALHALVNRCEELYQRDRTSFVLLLPLYSPGLRARGVRYNEEFRRIAVERHLAVVDLSGAAVAGDWGAQDERLSLEPAAARRFAERLARAVDPQAGRRWILGFGAAGAVLFLLFLFVQFRTHRRLKRLIARSCRTER